MKEINFYIYNLDLIPIKHEAAMKIKDIIQVINIKNPYKEK